MVRTRYYVVALCIAGVVFALAEGWARWALPRVPGCLDEVRNPFRFRGWPEYIADVRRAPTNRTVLLITNSQGYAGEYASDRTYPYLLEQQLNATRAGDREGWEVLNWSSDGMAFMEYMLLAGYVQRCRPTLVLAITGYADYCVEQADKGWMYCRTDVPRLATRPAVWRTLPRAVIRRHARIEDVLAFGCADRLALYRFREYAWSWLGTAYPGAFNLFYAPWINYIPWKVTAAVRGPSLTLPARPPERVNFTYQGPSQEMLREYLVALARIPARVVVVAAPRRPNPADSRRKWDAAFMADLQKLAPAEGLPLWDLREALPAKDYITASHFTGANHRRFADLLATNINALLTDAARSAASARPAD